ncbi:hypothetical protein GCM10010176_104850 [Nonomuraea spiralis]|nr:hypothetical protein GCM10010176_104850 [Nonomuraea spiralis]
METLVGMQHVRQRELARRGRVVGREAEGDHRANVVPGDVDAVVAWRAHHFVDVASHRLLVEAARGFVGRAHAPDVDGDHAVAAGEGRYDLVVAPPGGGPAGQQDERFTRASRHVVQSDPVDVDVGAAETAGE